MIQRYGAEFVGGAEKYGRSLATGLAAEGHEVTVITSCATSYADWADEYEPGTVVDEGVTVHRVPVRAPRDNDRFIPLHLRAVDRSDLPLWPLAQERWAQMMGPDLTEAAPLVRDVAAASDVTTFIGYHYGQTLQLTGTAAAVGATMVAPTAHPEGAFHVGRVGQMFDHADRIVCLAPEEADLVRDTYGHHERISVVPCPVDPIERPSDDAITAAAAAHGVAPGGYAIVVGRIDPAKGSDDAIRFASTYRRCIDPDFDLVVVGPGGDDRTDPAGIVSTGFVDEATKDALVAGASALVQPSYMESFSLALMEGWLLERPALVQRRSRVIAGHCNRSGGGITYGGYLDFEAGLVALARHPDLARAMGSNGRGYVLEQFAWPKVSREFLAVASEAADAGVHRLSSKRSVP